MQGVNSSREPANKLATAENAEERAGFVLGRRILKGNALVEEQSIFDVLYNMLYYIKRSFYERTLLIKFTN
jgi:hypothetical protein